VEHNRDNLPQDLIILATKSSNQLIAQELGKLLNVQHVKQVENGSETNGTTLIDKIRTQLHDLINTINNHETRYVRCLKPSELQIERRQIQHSTVMRQLRSSGFVVAVELSRNAFPQRIPFMALEEEFSCLVDYKSRKSLQQMEMHDKVQIMLSIMFAPLIEEYRNFDFTMPYACGKTRVFFREGALEFLQTRRHECMTIMAIRLQSWFRLTIMNFKYSNCIEAIVMLQANIRRRRRRISHQTERHSATRIQNVVKMNSSKNKFESKRIAVLVIQKWYRILMMQKRLITFRQAATTIARWRRSQYSRNIYFQKRWYSTMIPIYLKAMSNLKCFDTKKRQKLIKAIQPINSLFVHKIPIHLLEERFGCLIPSTSLKAMTGMKDYDKAQLMMFLLFAPYIEQCTEQRNYPMPFACGVKRVYFRAGSLEVLEITRREHYTLAVLKIQGWVKGIRELWKYRNTRNCIVRVQELYRARTAKSMTLAVCSFVRVLRDTGYLKPAYETALIKARANVTKIFPYILAYSVSIDRFALMLSRKHSRSISGMGQIDKTKYIMSILFTPFVELLKEKNLPIPFSCREDGVYLRVGSLEILEILRKEKIRRSAVTIQRMVRMMLVVPRARSIENAATRIQSFYRTVVSRQRFRVIRKSILQLQTWVRARLRESEKRNAAITIESICRVFLARIELGRRRASKKILALWFRSVVSKKRTESDNLLQAKSRKFQFEGSRQETISSHRHDDDDLSLVIGTDELVSKTGSGNSIILGEQKDTHNEQSDLYQTRPAHATILEPEVERSDHNENQEKTEQSLASGESLMYETTKMSTVCAIAGLEYTDRSIVSESHDVDRPCKTPSTQENTTKSDNTELTKSNPNSLYDRKESQVDYDSKNLKLISTNVSIMNDNLLAKHDTKPRTKGKETISNEELGSLSKKDPEKVLDGDNCVSSLALQEMEKYYKDQVEVLQNDMIQVTADAEIHSQEIQAEYEDRLSAYEAEVLQLQHNVESLESETAVLKKKLVLAQERYEDRIKNLKESMKKTEDSHRNYIEQVMSSVEKSKIENTKALESLTHGRDTRIRDLENEIAVLKSEQLTTQMQQQAAHPSINDQHTAAQEVHRLVQKAEKIVSAQHIMKLHENFGHDPRALKAAVEEKVSFKVRNIIGRLERMILVTVSSDSSKTSNIATENAAKEIKQLEQQLIHAYEEIETLAIERNAASKEGIEIRRFPSFKTKNTYNHSKGTTPF
jgi:myosin heavy subunit